jgi:hypothetical protein
MLCRQCGTEIADKALICYRCGTATTEPKFKPPAGTPRRSGSASLVASVLALALLVLFALYLGRIATGGTPRFLTWAAVGIALVVVVLRAYARRR